MGQWGHDPFENDNGIDEAYSHLNRLCRRVRQLACKRFRPGDSLAYDSYQMAAAAELAMLIARRIYRAVAFTAPIRGVPLPEPDEIARWRERFLARWDRYARRQFVGAAAEVASMGREAARPLDRLRRLSEQQDAKLEETFRAVQQDAHDRAVAESGPARRRGRK